MRPHTVALIGIYAFAQTAWASDDTCNSVATRIAAEGIAVGACQCSSRGLDSPDHGQSESMKLAAVCNYVRNLGGYEGHFFFEGNLVVSGTFSRERTETLGDTTAFRVDWLKTQRFPGIDLDLRFSSNEASLLAFKPPPLSNKASCWRAASTVRIHSLHSAFGPGTDHDRNYVQRFTLVRVGKFRKCAGETPGTNPSIERTSQRALRVPWPAARVER